MGVKGETSLQQRIQKAIKARGGYVNKNWGNMTSAPGIADLTACYKGQYLAIEVKDENNTPSAAQGIHCRDVQKAGGITLVAWSVDQVLFVLDQIDRWSAVLEENGTVKKGVETAMHFANLDDGTRW